MIVAQQFTAGLEESDEPVRVSGRLTKMLGYLIFSRPFHGLRLTFGRCSRAMNRRAILIRPLTRTRHTLQSRLTLTGKSLTRSCSLSRPT